MTRFRYAIIAVLTAVSVAYCGEGGPPAEEAGASSESGATSEMSAADAWLPMADTTQRLRGTLIMGTEVQVFRPCGSAREAWVLNHSGTLTGTMRELGIEPFQEFYVEVKATVGPPFELGPGAEYERLVTLTEIERASADTTLCR